MALIQKNGIIIIMVVNKNIQFKHGDEFSKLLKKVSEISDKTEALEYYENAINDGVGLNNIATELSVFYGFDISEYIDYQKGGF